MCSRGQSPGQGWLEGGWWVAGEGWGELGCASAAMSGRRPLEALGLPAGGVRGSASKWLQLLRRGLTVGALPWCPADPGDLALAKVRW